MPSFSFLLCLTLSTSWFHLVEITKSIKVGLTSHLASSTTRHFPGYFDLLSITHWSVLQYYNVKISGITLYTLAASIRTYRTPHTWMNAVRRTESNIIPYHDDCRRQKHQSGNDGYPHAVCKWIVEAEVTRSDAGFGVGEDKICMFIGIGKVKLLQTTWQYDKHHWCHKRFSCPHQPDYLADKKKKKKIKVLWYGIQL